MLLKGEVFLRNPPFSCEAILLIEGRSDFQYAFKYEYNDYFLIYARDLLFNFISIGIIFLDAALSLISTAHRVLFLTYVNQLASHKVIARSEFDLSTESHFLAMNRGSN